MKLRLDCRFFKGDKPCQYNQFCHGCGHYRPLGKKILIIKLEAMGDVLRTTPILTGLKRKYPLSHISWLTKKESIPLLENNPLIDKILPYDLDSRLRLEVETFDLVISLDKGAGAAALATLVKSDERVGYALSKEGNIYPLNKEAEYSFNLGLSNELKFTRNKKTYQEMIFELAGLDYRQYEYILNIPEKDRRYAQNFLKNKGIGEDALLIGLNSGCGSTFTTKKWTMEGFIDITERLHRGLSATILLFGGECEAERNCQIRSKSNVPVLDTGRDNTLLQLAALIDLCHVVVTGDTLALHMAIALKKKVVSIFGPTCPQEIDLYGRGKKIVSRADCAPCYRMFCPDMGCMKEISAEAVFRAVQELL